MASGLPTIPFMSQALTGGAAVNSQSASGVSGEAVLTCSLAAEFTAGIGSTKTSLGLALGLAPASTTRLRASISGTVFENAGVIATFGNASADAFVRFSLQEFLPPAFSFIQDQIGPPVFQYNDHETFFGVNLHQDEVHNVVLNSEFQVMPGRFYQLWVDVLQDVSSSAANSQAVSDFTYVLGGVTYFFE